MLAHERQDALKQILEEQGSVVVSDLARRWDVYEMTIRRDLQRLQDQGIVARVHGGAVAGGVLRWKARVSQHRAEKEAAAAKLAQFIPDSGCIYLDGSTTIYNLAQHFVRRGGLIVATNNVDTFQRLSQFAGIEAVVIGGVLNRETDNFVGPIARRSLTGLSFDAAFCSAYAMHPEHGACEPSVEDAEIKQIVSERSAHVYVAMNHHKLGERAAGCWEFDADKSTLATDLDAGDERLAPYRSSFRTII